MEDLERDCLAIRVPREKDPGIAAPTDLALHLISPGESLAHQRQHVAPDGLLLWL
jgi:hypothetical protein